MEISQSEDQAVDVAYWRMDEEFGPYPEGARDKTLFYSPSSPPFVFLKSNSRYLFKLSSHRYSEQFWDEILAYRLGCKMDVIVPPAFVAYDSKREQSGALIEWFVNNGEIRVLGGDYCQQYISGFDRKKGKQHNLETVFQIFTDLSKKHPDSKVNWLNYWTKALLFDALIGNTDRHQDNWSVIEDSKTLNIRISPVFDNGTSMGHEISDKKFRLFDSLEHIEKYVLKGKHHMKWSLNDREQLGHVKFVKKLGDAYPETRTVMADCLKKVDPTAFESIIDDLVKFEIPVRLSPERAKFMLKLLNFRHERLLRELEN